jgi:uncharacterized protein (DUF488 family)
MNYSVFTIGHSTQPITQFIAKLEVHGVTAVADVRSVPFSRHNPQFNKDELREELKRHGVRYVFLGKELGARSDDECCYVDNKVRYSILAETASFKSGIARVLEGTTKYKIALMCAERDPVECHRAILVARVLVRHGCDVNHILMDGSLEPQESTLARVIKQLEGEHSRDLFRPAVSADEAYETQGQRIAYDRSTQRNRVESSAPHGRSELVHTKSTGK